MIPKSLSKSELQEFQTLLHERRAFLQGDLDGLEGETRGRGSDRSGDQSSVPGHMAELASDASEKSLSFGRMESQAGELQEIKAALGRIEDGSFGSCEECQGRIPKERLKAISYARLCVKCQGKEEEEG
jgi:DnaK suppressor protein